MNGSGLVTEAVILAGGLGTRLRSVVSDRPKPMADIAGRPFLSYLIEHLGRQGVRRAVLAVGYQHDFIVKFFGNRYNDVFLEYSVEQEPQGTGGAFRRALDRITGGRVLLLNGDTFFAVDLAALSRQHADRRAELTLAVKPLRDLRRYGTVEMLEDGRVTGFREKQQVAGGCINGGVYLIERSLSGALAGLDVPFSFERDFLEPRAGSLRAFAFVSDAYFIDIGVPEDLERARRELPSLRERA